MKIQKMMLLQMISLMILVLSMYIIKTQKNLMIKLCLKRGKKKIQSLTISSMKFRTTVSWFIWNERRIQHLDSVKDRRNSWESNQMQVHHQHPNRKFRITLIKMMNLVRSMSVLNELNFKAVRRSLHFKTSC